MDKLSDFRQDYQRGELNYTDLPKAPLSLFENWLQTAIDESVLEPNAMILSTVTDKQPHARVVLLKGLDDNGLVFFTNYNSSKGKELTANPAASLLFFWPELQRQVRIEGTITKTSEEESDTYFYSRPKGSQAGAIASPQSEKIKSRDELDLAASEAEKGILRRPIHWGGYRLSPNYYEFWQGRSNRLHDRFSYQKNADNWDIHRLAP